MTKSQKENLNIFEGLYDQDMAISILESSIKKNHIAPAYIFAGAKGVGQKEIAIKFAEGLKKERSIYKSSRNQHSYLNHPDILWVEPTYLNQGKIITLSSAKTDNYISHKPPEIRLEQIKEIIKFTSRRPIELKYATVIIDNAEAMNESASNAMLKTLEEPSNGVIIFIAERPDKIINTIHSRCQLISFKPISEKSLTIIAKNFAKDNNIETLVDDYLKEILNIANGSPELLINNLKSLKEMPKDVFDMAKDLSKDPLTALNLARKITEEINSYDQIWLINLLQQFFWLKYYDSLTIKRLEKLRYQLFSFVNPRIAWEIALIEISVTKEKSLHD